MIKFILRSILALILFLKIGKSFDTSQSTFSGISSGDILTINQTYGLTVQARDAGGNAISATGEDIYVRVSDPCTRGVNMSCVPSPFTQSAMNGGELVQKLADNGGGSYSTNFALNHLGSATISIYRVTTGGVLNEYYNNKVISGTPDVTNTSADINYDWPSEITPGKDDVAARFTAKITPFNSGTHTLSLYQDNGSSLRINGVEIISRFGDDWWGTDNVNYAFNAFETYDLEVDLMNIDGPGGIVLSWDTGSGKTVLQADNFATSSDVGSSPIQISVTCPDKYEQVPSTTNQCRPVCGDGFVVGTEACDDGNTGINDGCNSDCTSVEASWVCSGGSITTQSSCTECTQGFYQNDPANPTSCVTQCGDGFRVGTEVCDDDNISNGDGCTFDCSAVEAGHVCDGGDASTKDTCVFCTAGYYQNDPANPTICVPECGDGLTVSPEACDDDNVIGGDGCSADCTTVESGWVCSGGSSSAQSSCVQCTQGFYQNDPVNPTTCVSRCGDGFKVGTEVCDDDNIIDGDGCSFDCAAIEAGFVCSGGDATTQDSCTLCPDGYYQNDPMNPTTCVTRCGDGLRAGTEICDDGNLADNDGCSMDCLTIESGFICTGGDTNTQDSCNQCPNALTPNSEQNACVGICGDGIVAIGEICDDSNTEEGDGCSADCKTVESGWKCDEESPSKCIKDYTSIPLSSDDKALQGSTLGITAGATAMNIMGSILSKSSPSGALTAVNQLQLLILLLLLDIYLPSKVINYLRSLTSSLITINIDWKFFIVFRKMIGWFDYPQDQDDLYIVNLESGSTLLNLNTFITIMVCLGVLHLFMTLLLFCNNESKRALIQMVRYLYNALSFQLYFTVIFEAFIFICLCSFSELKRFNISGTSAEKTSFFSSIVFSIFISGIIVCVTLIWYFTKTLPKDKLRLFQKELFEGLKLNRLARLYPLLFLFRRAVLCLYVVGLEFMDRQLFLSLYLITTSLQCAYMCLIRPHQKVSVNIQEIINEVLYVGFCLTLVWHYKEQHWNSIKTEIFFCCLLMNNIFNALFGLVMFIKTLLQRKPSASNRITIKVRSSAATKKKLSIDDQKLPKDKNIEEEKSNQPSPDFVRRYSNKSLTASKMSNVSRQSHISLREKFSLADVDVESLKDSV